MKRKRKIFWIYIILIILIYIIVFFFIKDRIAGSFAVNVDEPIYFDDLPDVITLQRGQDFLLDINYEEGYVFSDNTELFDIDKTNGMISFSPYDGGEYPVVLIALRDITEYEAKVVIFDIRE